MNLLPLKVDHRPDGSIEIQRDDGVPIAVMCCSAASPWNAEEIVKRVNCHDDLVESLKRVAWALKTEQRKGEQGWEFLLAAVESAIIKSKGVIHA